MKNDALDVVLNKITDKKDWQTLLEICDCKATIKLEDLSNKGLALAFNREIRSNYGNSFVNIFRDEYSPDYSDIVKATAERLSIKNIPDSLTDYGIEVLENKIIDEVLERAKKQIIKEQGFAAWDEIEKEAAADIDKLYAAGKIKPEGSILDFFTTGRLLEFCLLGGLGLFALWKINDTNWKKTIGAVVFIAVMRQKQKYNADL